MQKSGQILIPVLIFWAILGNAAIYPVCGTALSFSALTCSVLSVALQLFASGGNYTAVVSISKLSFSLTYTHTQISHLQCYN